MDEFTGRSAGRLGVLARVGEEEGANHPLIAGFSLPRFPFEKTNRFLVDLDRYFPFAVKPSHEFVDLRKFAWPNAPPLAIQLSFVVGVDDLIVSRDGATDRSLGWQVVGDTMEFPDHFAAIVSVFDFLFHIVFFLFSNNQRDLFRSITADAQ